MKDRDNFINWRGVRHMAAVIGVAGGSVLGFYNAWTAGSCLLIEPLITKPSQPYEIEGILDGYSRTKVYVDVGIPGIWSNQVTCVEWFSPGVDDGDRNTAEFHNSLGVWRGPLPDKENHIRVISPTGKTSDLTIVDETNGTVYESQ